MPPTSNDLLTSTKWDGSNETHNDYKIYMNKVSLWANTNDMAWIMKSTKRLRKAPSFQRPGSRAPPIGEKFLDKAQAAAREELLAEIQRSANTDAGVDANEQANDVTFGHKMGPLAEPDWDMIPTTSLTKTSALCYAEMGRRRSTWWHPCTCQAQAQASGCQPG